MVPGRKGGFGLDRPLPLGGGRRSVVDYLTADWHPSKQAITTQSSRFLLLPLAFEAEDAACNTMEDEETGKLQWMQDAMNVGYQHQLAGVDQHVRTKACNRSLYG